MVEKIVAACGGKIEGKRIGVLGLTFKPNTDDLRDAPALGIINALKTRGAHIVAHDPEGMEAAEPLLPGVAFASDPYTAADGTDAIVLVTEWTVFRSLDLARLKSAMRTPLFIDLRNVYRRQEMERAGFAYRSVGRPGEDVG
jgi:UDPglucose 6-dehydrogenase